MGTPEDGPRKKNGLCEKKGRCHFRKGKGHEGAGTPRLKGIGQRPKGSRSSASKWEKKPIGRLLHACEEKRFRSKTRNRVGSEVDEALLQQSAKLQRLYEER